MLLLSLVATLIAIVKIQGEEVILLDSTKKYNLNWTRYPHESHASTPGWTEQSYNNFYKQIHWRSYVVCDVAHHNINNWLLTPFIETRNVNRINIEITFQIRHCSLLSFKSEALNCKETISLYYNEFDEAPMNHSIFQLESFKLVDRFTTEKGRFNSEVMNTEIISVPVSRRGVLFAFKDQGACAAIYAVKVYSIICREVTVNFARFPATSVGPVAVQTTGTCVKNAETTSDEGSPVNLCKEDGKWTLFKGSCMCRAGFEPDHSNQLCIECIPGKFKSQSSNDQCAPCPEFSKSVNFAATECECWPGYFRAEMDPKNMSCTKPPSAPQNLTVTFVDRFSVSLAWEPSRDSGGRSDVTYGVYCSNCPHTVEWEPAAIGLNTTEVTVSGLDPSTQYKFQVFATNGVSNLTEEPAQKIAVDILTEESNINFIKLKVLSVNNYEISLAWYAPTIDSNDLNDIIKHYEVTYFPIDDADGTTHFITTKNSNINLTGLKTDTEYWIQVKAKLKRSWGEFSRVVYVRTGSKLETKEEELQVPTVMDFTDFLLVIIVVGIIATILMLLHLRQKANTIIMPTTVVSGKKALIGSSDKI